MASLYETPVTALRGVGEKRAGLFRKLGAPTVGDLLRCYPRAWEDLSCPGTIRTAPPDQPFAIRATVTRAPSAVRVHGGSTLYRAFADDGETVFPITFFNNPYVVNLLREGEEYIFYGRVHFSFQKRELLSPEFYPAAACPPIRPVYRQTQGLNSRAIGQAVKQALLLLPQTVRDPIPDDLRAARGLCSLTQALHDIHFPPTTQALETARTRLIFEELLVLQTGILLLGSRKRTQTGCVAASDRTEEFWQLLPFAPTNAQRRAVREAAADMASGFPMNRLVQGDVGSGKTA
ncbi:MAG: ATP-dependent DNA helicase RecG, partial [Hydrogeniiclostridium sp.]